MPSYPFYPKSNKFLVPGDFWPLELIDGTFAAGKVLQVPPAGSDHGRVMFYGALVDWHGSSLPTSDDLAGRTTLAQGSMHVKCIQVTGGAITGNCGVLPGEIWLTFEAYTVRRGLDVVRPAVRGEGTTLPHYTSWGYLVIWIRAHSIFSSVALPDGAQPLHPAVQI